MPGIGAHPRGLHLWWARRPLAAARAVLFAQLVNDPGFERGESFQRGIKAKDAQKERKRLFDIIQRLVQWENTTNEEVLDEARDEIWKSWRETCGLNKDHPRASELFNPNKLPAFHDPFAGGGAIPLEAQRLGLESYASDLNPVAVLINKAMIEIPPKFAGMPPVNPESHSEKKLFDQEWVGAHGLAEDVRYYGKWMQDEAEKRIGHLYPKAEVTKEMAQDRPDLKQYVGKKLTVIAWIWARTVKSPNPAYSDTDVPLVSSFVLSRSSNNLAYIEPVITGKYFEFKVKHGQAPENAKLGTTAGKRKAFKCLISGTPIDYKYIREEGRSGRMGSKLMAIVAEGNRGRVYLSPTTDSERIVHAADPEWVPKTKLHGKCRVNVSNYGLDVYADLFTKRQLIALTTFSDLIGDVIVKIKQDALKTHKVGLSKLQDPENLSVTYAESISVYLAFAIDRCADFSNTCTRWVPGNQKVMNLFGKQAIPMTWDYPEAAILSNTVGGFDPAVKYIASCIQKLPTNKILPLGRAIQSDAVTSDISKNKIVSTDPPYYDNIGYADLSDFFYVWLRRALHPASPELFATLAAPKDEELVATPYRHGSKEKAESFFLNGMTHAMGRLADRAHPAFPVTIYYAFKQSNTADGNTGNTGWETFLDAVIRAGFVITGTWPMRSEQAFRMISMGSNALASSIVLVCRKRSNEAPSITRREFLRELKEELESALDTMISGADNISPVAPVDLAQAIIGPGMAVYSKYSAVLEADGRKMSVHDALILINRSLADSSGEFDAETQFCLDWFSQQFWNSSSFGSADVLARAKGSSVERIKEAGVLEAEAGKVKLLKPSEYAGKWDPSRDKNIPSWELLHRISASLESGGTEAAAKLLARVEAEKASPAPIRKLAYRLYTLCERNGKAEDARRYNNLIAAWDTIIQKAESMGRAGSQANLFNDI